MCKLHMRPFLPHQQISKNKRFSEEDGLELAQETGIRNQSESGHDYQNLCNIVINNSDHIYSSRELNIKSPMQLTDEQFDQFMINLEFKKNEGFKADPKNLDRVIKYVINMPINEKSFEIIEYLIKEYSVPVLYCFQYFYKTILKDHSMLAQFEANLQRISALVINAISPSNCAELVFFSVVGAAKKRFKLREKTPLELEFIKDLEYIRQRIIEKKEDPKLQNVTPQQLRQLRKIQEKVLTNKFNRFMCYYVNKMFNNVNKVFKMEIIEGSTMEDQEEETEKYLNPFEKKTAKSNKVEFPIKQQTIQRKLEQIQSHPADQDNKDDKNIGNPKETEPGQIQALVAQTKDLNNQDKKSTPSTKASTTATSSKQSYDLPPKLIEIPEVNEVYQALKRQKLENQKNQKSLTSGAKTTKSAAYKNQHPQRTKDGNPNSSNFSSSGIGMNFALIPLCCRTYFFDQERILPAEDKRTEYKSYRFPFSPASIETFKKTICAFLNTLGGEIYIGIKETTNKKYRYILGNYLTENDKEEVLKSFRKITEAIKPNMTQNLQVEFVPVRFSPFQNITLLNQIQTYYYDFSKKELKIEHCPYRPARYVIRVRVPMGIREEMYSYVETECQLNKNATSNEFIPFRSQNEVLVKEISQEVLKKFREKLIYGQEKDGKAHVGACYKPEIGNPRNEPEPPEQMIDPKEIEASLVMEKKKPNPFEKKESYQEQPYDSSAITESSVTEETRAQKNTSKARIYTQQELRKILNYPLSFVVLRMSQDRLKKCIDKTPAKDYTLISLQKNELTGQDLLLIRVDACAHMEQFLRVKAKIESHFHKDNVEFVGVSKTIRLESLENRRIAEQLITQHNHKHAFNNRNVEFYSLIVAASYLLYMRELGYRVEAIPD